MDAAPARWKPPSICSRGWKPSLGRLPFTCVVNKADLRESWEVDAAALERLSGLGWTFLLTSAKTGEGVEELFQELAVRMLQEKESHG